MCQLGDAISEAVEAPKGDTSGAVDTRPAHATVRGPGSTPGEMQEAPEVLQERHVGLEGVQEGRQAAVAAAGPLDTGPPAPSLPVCENEDNWGGIRHETWALWFGIPKAAAIEMVQRSSQSETAEFLQRQQKSNNLRALTTG